MKKNHIYYILIIAIGVILFSISIYHSNYNKQNENNNIKESNEVPMEILNPTDKNKDIHEEIKIQTAYYTKDNEIFIFFNDNYKFEDKTLYIVDENNKIVESSYVGDSTFKKIVLKNKINETYKIKFDLKNGLSYNIIEYNSLQYKQENIEFVENDVIKIRFNKKIDNIGYLYTYNFKGYILKTDGNNVFIKITDKNATNSYGYDLKYSTNSYGLNVPTVFGNFAFTEKEHVSTKIEKVSVLTNKDIKIYLNQNITNTINKYKENILVISSKNLNNQQIKTIDANENILTIKFENNLDNGVYVVSLQNLKDSFDNIITNEDFIFNVNFSYDKVIPLSISNFKFFNNNITFTLNHDIDDKQVYDLNNYEILSLDNYDFHYQVLDANYNKETKTVKLTTNYDMNTGKALIRIKSLHDKDGNLVIQKSYYLESPDTIIKTHINDIKFVIVNKKNLINNLSEGYYIKVNLNSIPKNINTQDIQFLTNKSLIKTEGVIINNDIFYKLNTEYLGKKILVKTSNSNSLYDKNIEVMIPPIEKLNSPYFNLFKIKNKNYISIIDKQLNYDIDYTKIVVTSNNEEIKYEKENDTGTVLLHLDNDSDLSNVLVRYTLNEKEFTNSLKYININLPTFKSIKLKNTNTLRLYFADDSIYNYADNSSFGVIEDDTQKIIPVVKIDVQDTYIDIKTNSGLEKDKYSIAISEKILKSTYTNLIQSSSVNLSFSGKDISTFITPYVNFGSVKNNGYSEIILHRDEQGERNIYGEPKSTEGNSIINLYTSDGFLISTTKNKQDGSFDNIKIPFIYKENTFVLESIDAYGNYEILKIVFN